MLKRFLLPAMLLCSLGLVAVVTLQQPHFRELFSPEYRRSMDKLSSVMRLVHNEYVFSERSGYEELTEAALAGMMSSLDEYSMYLPPNDYTRFEEDAHQRYVGVGIEVEALDGQVTVVGVFPDGPAAQAGLLPGDLIVGVDNRETTTATVSELVSMIRGRAGTEVGLTYERPSSGERRMVAITRAAIEVATVRDRRIDADGIAYARLTNFGDNTASEFESLLLWLYEEEPAGFILDLRGNPGGLLSSAKNVLELFFPAGELMVFTEGRDGRDREEFRARRTAVGLPCPLVVIVNGNTASAAEIVAGALQDTGRAIVVGETTVGKGLVQSVYSLRDGDGLRATTGIYYLPSGRTVNEVGVIPDHVVELPLTDYLQLDVLRRHRTFMDEATLLETFGEEVLELEDTQLEAARLLLLEGLITSGRASA